MEIRNIQDNELAGFINIWKQVFGDSDKWLDMYTKSYLDYAKAFAAFEDGKMVSILSYYEHKGLFDEAGNNLGQVPTTYAGATPVKYRGHNYFMQIMSHIMGLCEKNGCLGIGIMPAEESLFTLYEDRFSYKSYFTATVINASSGDLTPWEYEMDVDRRPTLNVISGPKYNQLREKILKGHAHLAFTNEQIKFVKDSSMLTGGNLFEIKGLSETSLACVERISNKEVRITELLVAPKDLKDAVALIRREFHGDRYEIRLGDWMMQDGHVLGIDADDLSLQSDTFDVSTQTMGMIKQVDVEAVLPESAYAGFIFD